MINRTNFLRTAAACVTLCAAPLSMRAEGITIENVIEFMQSSKEEAKSLAQKVDPENMEYIMAHLNAVYEDVKTLYNEVNATSWWNADALKALSEKIAVYKGTIIPEINDVKRFLFDTEAFNPGSVFEHYGKDHSNFEWLKSHLVINITEFNLDQKEQVLNRFNNICNFAKDLISSATYSDAWQVVVAPDTLLGKAEILWDHHKPAVVGVAIVATAVTACILGRNKIKAGWNRLFGSSAQAEETK